MICVRSCVILVVMGWLRLVMMLFCLLLWYLLKIEICVLKLVLCLVKVVFDIVLVKIRCVVLVRWLKVLDQVGVFGVKLVLVMVMS